MTASALIVGAAFVEGADDFYRALFARSEFIIACDGAAERCVALGRTPDVAVGDFDSAEPRAAARLANAGVDVRHFSAEKDESDLDLALIVARGAHAAHVTFTGAFSQRLDHTLAAFGTVSAAGDLHATIEEPGFRGVILSSRGTPAVDLDIVPGTLISVLALEPSRGVTLTGMQYPLIDADLGVLASLGISNVAIEPRATVALTEGTLLVMVLREDHESRG